MSNMREKCDLCNHHDVCKNIEEAYALQDKVDGIQHSDSFEINISCKNFRENYPFVTAPRHLNPFRIDPNTQPKVTAMNKDEDRSSSC